jgi:hypothetical protein
MSVAQRTRGQEAVRSGYLPVSRRLLMAAPMAAFAAAAAHLAWEASHGGIKSHHLLNQTDLPAVSNSWGRRTTTSANALSRALAAFCGSLMVALALSAAFRLESSNLTAGLFFAVLLSGVALRTYRAEYVFGFVLGMTFVFGSVLPTMAALVAGAVSVLAHFVLYPVVAALYKRLCVATG